MQAILIILGVYLLYKFMVDFVIPIYKTTKKFQEQFRNVQQRASENGNPAQNNYNTSSATNTSKASSKDYIEFEEIKD